MRFIAARLIPLLVLFLLSSHSLYSNVESIEKIRSGNSGFDSKVVPFLKSYCVQCHGPDEKKGEVILESISGEMLSGQDRETWELILDALRHNEMPPDEAMDRPTESERLAVVSWIESELNNSITKEDNKKGSVSVRRLTNFEYENTMRDLLGFDLKLSEDLPADPIKPYHFNNNAGMMMIGPDQLIRYKEAARKVMRSAIVDPGQPEIHRSSSQWDNKLIGKSGMSQAEIGVYQGPGVGRKTFSVKSWPQTGKFIIRAKAYGIIPDGFNHVPLRLVMGTDLRHDSGSGIYHEVGVAHIRKSSKSPQIYEFTGRIENIPIQPSVTHRNKLRPPSITITAQNIFDNGQLNDHRKSGFDASWSLKAPRVVLESLEFEAPLMSVWPPEHHTRILFESALREENEDMYAYNVIERFMQRAFRKPVSKKEVDHYHSIYKLFVGELDTFESAMRETLAMVLISPQFLYHTRVKDDEAKPYELASRLSYFLWGSMPDNELLENAKSNYLRDSKNIEIQARRMLSDKRSKDFIKNFTMQWLSISKMKTVNINRDLFPRFLYTVHVGERRGQEQLFRPTIRDYMIEETVGYVGEMLNSNMGVMNIVDSKFAYLNEPLAAHYGVRGVDGLEFRKVSTRPENHLGGLLTHGSVLIGNSTGSAPHPIYRAVWLREAILGQEVKPPPAEVPALSDSAGESAEDSVLIKDLLALHRNKKDCHDCHARLDPWGIPFEHYNAVGKYQPLVPKEGIRVRGFDHNKDIQRSDYNNYLKTINTVKVDASAKIPNGPSVNGMEELKEYLINHKEDEIAENVLRKLMTYAIGRELKFRDRTEIQKILKKLKVDGYRFRDMVIEVCKSSIFRQYQ